MKIKRHKHVRRILKFYQTNFGLKEPYQVLIDGTFAQEALKSKINISEQMGKYLETEKCKLMTTKCAINETEVLGPATYGAMVILKQFTVVPCDHKEKFVTTEKCFRRVLEKKAANEHFFIATQVIRSNIDIFEFEKKNENCLYRLMD